MESLIVDVNWVAVTVGTVLSFLLGWVWYSPKLFGTKWANDIGINISDKSGPAGLAMVAQLVGTFLLAWVIGITERTDDLFLAVLVACMVASLIKANGLFAQKSKYVIMVESGYILAMVVVMILVQAVL